MPAIIQRHVDFAAKEADGDALLKHGELTTFEAATLAECSTETIRQWIRKHRIGRWEPRLRAFIVDHQRLDAHLNRRRKKPWPKPSHPAA
jgi:excisionase family DNA binding protein